MSSALKMSAPPLHIKQKLFLNIGKPSRDLLGNMEKLFRSQEPPLKT